jgi:hypothetical protein
MGNKTKHSYGMSQLQKKVSMMLCGKEFEIEVKNALERVLSAGELGLEPSHAKIHHRKGYCSRDRGKKIIIDISIELFPKDAQTPVLIWVWECKDYNRLVPVDDVEEFHSKLEQIGADNTKGTIITRNGFQRSAFQYAQAKGIGLCRLFPSDELLWILYHHPLKVHQRPDPEEIANVFCTADFKPGGRNFYAITSGSKVEAFGSLWSFVHLQLAEWGFEPHVEV